MTGRNEELAPEESYDPPFIEEAGDFTRAGWVYGTLMNKVMASTWPEDKIPGGRRPLVHISELELLANAISSVPDNYRAAIQNVHGKLEVGSPYPVLSIDEIQSLNAALGEYGTIVARPFAAKLMELSEKGIASDNVLKSLLYNVMMCLAPSLMPAQYAVGGPRGPAPDFEYLLNL